MTRTTSPSTAAELLQALADYGPIVVEDGLEFALDLPIDLEPVLAVLHTAVRAGLTRKAWLGCSSDTGRVVELSLDAKIPAGITLLAVEGDGAWDRIDPAAHLDHPRLFRNGRSG